jgi:uncharacterized protein
VTQPDPPDPTESTPESFLQSLDPLFVIGGLFASIFLGVLFGGVASSVVGTQKDLRVMFVGQAGLWAGLLGAVFLAARHVRIPIRERFGLVFRPVDTLWAALGPVLQVLIGLAYRPFVDAAKLEKAAKDVVDLAKGQVNAYVLLSLSVVIGAPIVEELFFRGLVVRSVTGLRRPSVASTGVKVMAVVISGALFGLIHFEPLQLPALAVFGAIAAMLAVRFDRLGPSICLHMGFNAATMATLAWSTFR